MRKLTGYIGAMIIVFALMGSILAGYALNINGNTAVVNEYEKVTDVSGLYTHSQEPSYIDYNPASNYIGYNLSNNNDNPTGQYYFKEITNGTAKWRASDEHWILNGVDQGVLTRCLLICEYAYFYDDNPVTLWRTDGSKVQTDNAHDIDITLSNGTITFSTNGFGTYTYNNVHKILARVSNSDQGDYYSVDSIYNGDTVDNLYLNNREQILMINYPVRGITNGNTWRGIDTNHGTTYDASGFYTGETEIGPGTYKYAQIGGYIGNGSGMWGIFYPKSINNGLGINYTESNRVNNYPMETEYDTSTTTQTNDVLLSSISASDQAGNLNGIFQVTDTGYYMDVSYNTVWYLPTNHAYRLSDILSTLTIPADTSKIKISTPATLTSHLKSFTITSDQYGSSTNVNISYPTLDNWAYIVTVDDWNVGPQSTKWFKNQNYVIYDVETGVCDVFNGNDGKIMTTVPQLLCVYFVDNVSTGNVVTQYFTPSSSTSTTTYDATPRVDPYIHIEYTITGLVTDVHYSDITKGYSIKSDNASPVIWNNTYDNGKIQLLFRAENTPGDYHNDFTVGDNTVSVDYTLNRFYVTLNGGDPVDIGTWRNIVLDIDLVNGELSAIPVRTFNSYTNVVLDNTNIFVGDLVNPAPTNIITWSTTPNSLMFNVYTTSVFMDTYGVVMVNPTLNITDYFTDLDNFYQLRLENLTIYGQSMTINGVTGNVTGNTIKFNDETVQIKDMEITYADGHAYISDSYATIDLGAITDNTISMTGAWYFTTDLYDGYTAQKMIYEWDWGEFILDDKTFGVIYIGLCLIGLIVARKFCSMTITDYLLFVVSIIIALGVPVIV